MLIRKWIMALLESHTEMSWGEKITAPKEKKVFESLAESSWRFRTVKSISNATGVPESEVTMILDKYPEFIRKSIVPDRQGNELFALRSFPTAITAIAQAITSTGASGGVNLLLERRKNGEETQH